MPRKETVVDEAYVMSQKVVGLKKLCRKYKLPLKGKKAELQTAILKHLKLGKWSEETAIPAGSEGQTGSKAITETPTDETKPEEAVTEETKPEETVAAREDASNTKQEQWTNVLTLGAQKPLPESGSKVDLMKKPEEGLLVIELEKPHQIDDTVMKKPEEEHMLIELEKPPHIDDKVSEEEPVDPFAGMQPLPLFPRDDNVESSQKRTAEKAGISGDQGTAKKRKLETGSTNTPPSFPPFYNDDWVVVDKTASMPSTPAKNRKRDLPKSATASETKRVRLGKMNEDIPDARSVMTSGELGKTKAEIEEFLNRHNENELVDLCMELCAVDPGLLHELRKQNGKAEDQRQLSLRKILIYGLNPELTTASDLELAFSKHGNISETVVVQDDAGRSKGYGFITMSTVAEAGVALQKAPRLLDGWPTRCTLATSTRRK